MVNSIKGSNMSTEQFPETDAINYTPLKEQFLCSAASENQTEKYQKSVLCLINIWMDFQQPKHKLWSQTRATEIAFTIWPWCYPILSHRGET